MRLLSKCTGLMRTLPFVTAAMGLGAVLLSLLPSSFTFLGYDRVAIGSWQVWRLLTCHFVHVNVSHLLWDLSALMVLGFLFEAPLRKSYIMSIAAGIVIIPVAVFIFQPGLRYYCGLSGLDTAAYTLCAFSILKTALDEKRLLTAILMLSAMAALVFKIIYEFRTGLTLFADHNGNSFSPVPLAHVIGGATGIIAARFFLPKGIAHRQDTGAIHF